MTGKCDRCKKVRPLAYFQHGQSMYRQTHGHDGVWICADCDLRTKEGIVWEETHQSDLRLHGYAKHLSENGRLHQGVTF